MDGRCRCLFEEEVHVYLLSVVTLVGVEALLVVVLLLAAAAAVAGCCAACHQFGPKCVLDAVGAATAAVVVVAGGVCCAAVKFGPKYTTSLMLRGSTDAAVV